MAKPTAKNTLKRAPSLPALLLGTVVHDKNGHPWVYIGTTQKKSGSWEHWFRVSMPLPKGMFPGWDYQAVHRETLINKFPDLVNYWPDTCN